MPSERYQVLVNPNAGHFRGLPTPEELQTLFDRAGTPGQVIATESEEDLIARLRAAVQESAERIVVAGGDGTIAVAARELAHTDTTLGILPWGTNNNFAGGLALPVEPEDAIQVLRDGRPVHVDLGKANGDYFVEAAGIGLYANTLSLYRQGPDKSFFRAWAAAYRTLSKLESFEIRLLLDGEERVERVVMCEIANTPDLGSSLHLAPQARLTDGCLDVVLLRKVSAWDIVRYFRSLRKMRWIDIPELETYRAATVEVNTDKPMKLRRDGQVDGQTPLRVEVDPGALRVIAPAASGGPEPG